ncbi:MAG: hypothetical protein ACJ741_13050 [Pyrinomonadaceae bacterium]
MQTAQLADNFADNYYAPPQATTADPDLGARLTWLVNANAAADLRARLRRHPREEEEALMMHRPLAPAQAFARFGLLLGTLPPAAIFCRILFALGDKMIWLTLLFVPALLICALLGRRMGARFGAGFNESGRGSWWRTIFDALEDAFVWAAATGTAGGALFFGVGGLLGFVCALPVALVAFLCFAPLHRLLARDGMIDARHFYPLAWGINLTIAALILSPNVMPY